MNILKMELTKIKSIARLQEIKSGKLKTLLKITINIRWKSQ